MGLEAEETLLRKLGLNVHAPATGCCGMAGAFGFEAGDHYDVSVACGERVLLPEVRQAGDATLIVADGFSCREQIAQQTGRYALHLAQVIQMALRDEPQWPRDARPEADVVRRRRSHARRANAKAALVAAGAVGAVWWLARGSRGRDG
jgi:hypothetical protein